MWRGPGEIYRTPQTEVCATKPTDRYYERINHNRDDIGELLELLDSHRWRALLSGVRKNSAAAKGRRLLRVLRPAAETDSGPGHARAAIPLALLEAASRPFRARLRR